MDWWHEGPPPWHRYPLRQRPEDLEHIELVNCIARECKLHTIVLEQTNNDVAFYLSALHMMKERNDVVRAFCGASPLCGNFHLVQRVLSFIVPADLTWSRYPNIVTTAGDPVLPYDDGHHLLRHFNGFDADDEQHAWRLAARRRILELAGRAALRDEMKLKRFTVALQTIWERLKQHFDGSSEGADAEQPIIRRRLRGEQTHTRTRSRSSRRT